MSLVEDLLQTEPYEGVGNETVEEGDYVRINLSTIITDIRLCKVIEVSGKHVIVITGSDEASQSYKVPIKNIVEVTRKAD